jgi:hypothetical protein
MNQSTLLFSLGFDERNAFEAVVQIPSVEKFTVSFYDPVRLALDLETAILNTGRFALLRRIVIPRVTLDCMRQAAEKLFKEGYFDHLNHWSRRVCGTVLTRPRLRARDHATYAISRGALGFLDPFCCWFSFRRCSQHSLRHDSDRGKRNESSRPTD